MGKGIRKALRNVGRNLGYKEAAKIAEKKGVSVDRVYNTASKAGVSSSVGAAAANAGYTPPSGTSYKPGYVTALGNQASSQSAAESAAANWDGTGEQPVVPEFDWEAWNSQMMAQQAAVWESMDAMNSEFLRQQQAYLEQQNSKPRMGTVFGGGSGGNSDPAAVRRKKRSKGKAGIKTNTGLSTGSAGGAGGSGLSLGGGGGNGLSIGKS